MPKHMFDTATLPFTNFEGMSLAEICRPLSAETMPAKAKWGFGGLEMTHTAVLQQQRIQVIKTFQRNRKGRKK